MLGPIHLAITNYKKVLCKKKYNTPWDWMPVGYKRAKSSFEWVFHEANKEYGLCEKCFDVYFDMEAKKLCKKGQSN